MPKTKIKQKDEFDRFYTKKDVALSCYNTVLNYVSDDDVIIEPSAGDGSFSDIIREPSISYDICPKKNNIIKKNWFDVEVPENSVILGNPPYGNRNNLSKKFISHSVDKAKCIAFILPMVYKKETLQSVFPKNWCLVEEFILPNDSFLLNGEDYHVPCVFQVWINEKLYDIKYNNKRESIKSKKVTNDFYFTTDKKSADYFIFGASPKKLINPERVNKNNRGYYIISNIENFEEKVKNINWKKYSLSSVNGGVSWFTKQEIIDAYCDTYNYSNNDD